MPAKGASKTCRYCHKTFNRSWHRKRHEAGHKNKRAFKCTKCMAGFNDADALRHHLEVHDRGGKWHDCPHCQEHIFGTYRFRKHVRTCEQQPASRSTKTWYTCQYCDKCLYTERGFERHKQQCRQRPPRSLVELFRCTELFRRFPVMYDDFIYYLKKEFTPSMEVTIQLHDHKSDKCILQLTHYRGDAWLMVDTLQPEVCQTPELVPSENARVKLLQLAEAIARELQCNTIMHRDKTELTGTLYWMTTLGYNQTWFEMQGYRPLNAFNYDTMLRMRKEVSETRIGDIPAATITLPSRVRRDQTLPQAIREEYDANILHFLLAQYKTLVCDAFSNLYEKNIM